MRVRVRPSSVGAPVQECWRGILEKRVGHGRGA
jgi:hypothetical protein